MPSRSDDRAFELPEDYRLTEQLDAYLSGASGVPFEALIWFCEPLFDLYDADPRALAEPDRRERDAQELSLQISVLDTGRLLLSYLLLEPERHAGALPRLQERLLGRAPTENERRDLDELLHIMQERLAAFDQRYRRMLQRVRKDLPPFAHLLEQYAPEPTDEASAGGERFGPDRLDLPEALALFARPLLDEFNAEDPDALEDQLALSHAYWDYAQASREDQAEILHLIERTFAVRPAEARAWAERMTRRFFELFPERTPHGPAA